MYKLKYVKDCFRFLKQIDASSFMLVHSNCNSQTWSRKETWQGTTWGHGRLLTLQLLICLNWHRSECKLTQEFKFNYAPFRLYAPHSPSGPLPMMVTMSIDSATHYSAVFWLIYGWMKVMAGEQLSQGANYNNSTVIVHRPLWCLCKSIHL